MHMPTKTRFGLWPPPLPQIIFSFLSGNKYSFKIKSIVFNSNLESYTILNCKQTKASKTAQKQSLERSPFHFQNAYRYDKNQKVSITFLYIYRTNKRVLSRSVHHIPVKAQHKHNSFVCGRNRRNWEKRIVWLLWCMKR